MYKRLIRPLLFKLDAESAHHLALTALKAAVLPPARKLVQSFFSFEDPALSVSALGLKFPNPVGVAAGFDKNGECLEGLSLLGFGFLEAGTVTTLPQKGNPKPRMRRLPNLQALWNRLGFNNRGAEAVAASLKKNALKIPFGVNIGKSRIVPVEKAIDDYLAALSILYPCGDYFMINVSSPNTPGLRELEEKKALGALLTAVQEKSKVLAQQLQISPKPILVKISPDLNPRQLDAVLEILIEKNVAGIAATNTTLSREGLPRDIPAEGGVSGLPLKDPSTRIIRQIWKSAGKRLCIIGVGGIFSARDAYEKIRSGASLVQVYTGLIYEGPALAKKIKQGLLELLKQDGISAIQDAVGTARQR